LITTSIININSDIDLYKIENIVANLVDYNSQFILLSLNNQYDGELVKEMTEMAFNIDCEGNPVSARLGLFFNSSKYVAGYSMSGIGAYYKFPTKSNMGEYYFGLGYQGLDEIATNNSLWVKAPYGIVGLKGYYFNNCELKIEGNIGIISTINFGFGVRL
jgi:hypothetical protein